MARLEEVVEWKRTHLGEEDHSRLASEHELASAYLNGRRIHDAIKSLEHVVFIEKDILAAMTQNGGYPNICYKMLKRCYQILVYSL